MTTHDTPEAHRHDWMVEQQTGHTHCNLCGVHGPRRPTHDTPEAVLAAALHDAMCVSICDPRGHAADSYWKARTAAILAALDGWTLVPSDDLRLYSVTVISEQAAEIARLRAVLGNADPGQFWGDWRHRDTELGVAPAPVPSEP